MNKNAHVGVFNTVLRQTSPPYCWRKFCTCNFHYGATVVVKQKPMLQTRASNHFLGGFFFALKNHIRSTYRKFLHIAQTLPNQRSTKQYLTLMNQSGALQTSKTVRSVRCINNECKHKCKLLWQSVAFVLSEFH